MLSQFQHARQLLTSFQPQPDYEVGEKAYLQYEDRRMGTFLVYIATPGRWNSDKQDIEYQLRLGNATDGPWYKNGEWIGEKALKTK
jgi:hypothetical protein